MNFENPSLDNIPNLAIKKRLYRGNHSGRIIAFQDRHEATFNTFYHDREVKEMTQY